MYEAMIINMVLVLAIMVLNLVLMLKVKVPVLNIVSGIILILMAWGIGALPGAPWFPLLATFFGIFTVAESTKGVIY